MKNKKEKEITSVYPGTPFYLGLFFVLFFPLILLELFHLGLMCFFPSRPCLMAKSLTGTTTAASGSGLESCPTRTLMASLSFGGKIRRKSRKPLKLVGLKEVGGIIHGVWSSAGIVLSFVGLLWWFNVHVPSASDVRRIVEVSLHSRARMLTVSSRMLNQWGEKAKSVGRYIKKHFSLSWLVYLVFSSLMLTDAVVVCCFYGTFSAVHGYGGSLVLLSMGCLSCSVFKFWTNEWLEHQSFINADCL